MASHLYKDGHVTHNWQQMAFLQEVFNKEDALRAEVDYYGSSAPKRSDMLDWNEFQTVSKNNKFPVHLLLYVYITYFAKYFVKTNFGTRSNVCYLLYCDSYSRGSRQQQVLPVRDLLGHRNLNVLSLLRNLD
jgi:hypothetical protein